VVAEGSEPTVGLSESERAGYEKCEGILQRGLITFYEVASALLRIQEGGWYRCEYRSFEQYCRERWNIGRAYAYRFIGAAERLKLLPGDDSVPRPVNEFQMRPFLKLEPEAFLGAWKRAVKNAKGGKVTIRIVQAVIRDLLPKEAEGKKKKRRKAKVPLGQFLALLNEAKRCMEKGESDKVLAASLTEMGLP
jgi:hypothetical protein